MKFSKKLILCLLISAAAIVSCEKEKSKPAVIHPLEAPQFLNCKINGVEYKSTGLSLDTTQMDSVGIVTLYSQTGANEQLILTFYAPSQPISYNVGDFYGYHSYVKNNLQYLYFSQEGSMTFSKVSNRFEGTFEFLAIEDSNQDTVNITEGSFSIKR